MNGFFARGLKSWVAREQFLAGAGFAAQQDRRMAARHHADLVERMLERGAGTDDAAGERLGPALGRQFLFQQPLLIHQPLAIALHHVHQPHGLADQVGDHGQEPHIFVGRVIGRVRVPDLFDRQRADDAVAVLDRHADERHARALRSRFLALPSGEQRAGRHVGNDDRHARGDDLADRALRQAAEPAMRLFLAPAHADDAAGIAALVEQGDNAVVQFEETRQQGQDIGQGVFQPDRHGENLRDFVYPAKCDIGAGMGCGARPRGALAHVRKGERARFGIDRRSIEHDDDLPAVSAILPLSEHIETGFAIRVRCSKM